jgi:hypothetical protein
VSLLDLGEVVDTSSTRSSMSRYRDMLILQNFVWFWLGNCPPGLERWFRSGESPGGGNEGEPRVDRYYHQKGNVELGIKVRDERADAPSDVEVKGLARKGLNEDLCRSRSAANFCTKS